MDDSGGRVTHVVGVAELIGTAAAAVAAAMVALLSTGTRQPGVMTTSDLDLPAATILGNVLRHGVRLELSPVAKSVGRAPARLDSRSAPPGRPHHG